MPNFKDFLKSQLPSPKIAQFNQEFHLQPNAKETRSGVWSGPFSQFMDILKRYQPGKVKGTEQNLMWVKDLVKGTITWEKADLQLVCIYDKYATGGAGYTRIGAILNIYGHSSSGQKVSVGYRQTESFLSGKTVWSIDGINFNGSLNPMYRD